ncbi:MAG: peptidyl-prolyl cis-trans isomerase [Armatimonadetes bacterium]|nr:peptidyl-prolyl cis-trans isomerase [Armatimonadota bacterium]
MRRTACALAALWVVLPVRAQDDLATVDGQPIPQERFQRQLEQRFGYRFVETAILSDLILAAAQKAGQTPNPGEVDAELDLFLHENFSNQPERYQRWLKEYGRDEITLRDEIRVQVAQRKLRSRGIPTDDDTLKRFFDKNQDLYERPESYVYRQIIVPWKGKTPKEDEGGADPDNLAAAQAVLARIEHGEDFVKVAREVSEDPGAQRTGGRIGPVPADRLAGFSAALFDALKDLEPGQCAKRPVYYGQRFLVLLLLEHDPVVHADFQRQHARIAADWLATQMNPQDQFLADLVRGARIEIKDPRFAGMKVSGVWTSPCGLGLPGWLEDSR